MPMYVWEEESSFVLYVRTDVSPTWWHEGGNQPNCENHRKRSLIVSKTIVKCKFPELSVIRLMISFCDSLCWVRWLLHFGPPVPLESHPGAVDSDS
jgi:hypothetical protein